jgi:hypothetical protein
VYGAFRPSLFYSPNWVRDLTALTHERGGGTWRASNAVLRTVSDAELRYRSRRGGFLDRDQRC